MYRKKPTYNTVPCITRGATFRLKKWLKCVSPVYSTRGTFMTFELLEQRPSTITSTINSTSTKRILIEQIEKMFQTVSDEIKKL